MKKRTILMAVIGAMLLVGVAFADQLKLVSYEGTVAWRGQYNFETVPPSQFLWGYCTEETIFSNVGELYTYQLRDVTGYYAPKSDFGLDAADLIWKQYADGVVSDAEKTQLQFDIWALWTDDAFYNSYKRQYSDATLEGLFSIAYVVNSDGYGQDFIVYNPVSEPATMMLLGLGLLGLGAFGRRKFA